MKWHNYKSKTHPIHVDIMPIVSAFKFGNKRLGKVRFEKLTVKLNLAQWEAIEVSKMIREKCKSLGVSIPQT